MASVWLVIDAANAPGRVLSVFHDAEDAEAFADGLHEGATIEQRTLWYGQPPSRDYNE